MENEGDLEMEKHPAKSVVKGLSVLIMCFAVLMVFSVVSLLL